MIGQFLVSFNIFLGILFLFQRFSNVEGFNYHEVLLCFSILLMEFSIAECIARGFDMFDSIIRNGEFDRIMVRPRNEILQVLGSKFELTRIGRMLQAIVMFIYGITCSHIEWTFCKVITVIFMLMGGAALFFGIFLVYAALCFFTLEGLEFMNVLTDGAREYGKYPVAIYGKRMLQFCTFIVPYALVQYYPLLYLLDRKSSLFYVFIPLAAFLFLIPCILLWKLGVKHYKSSGS
jgi:ABC-2 type transport system permease protein